MTLQRALFREALVPMAAILAILMLVIPVPAMVLDFFLILNIGLSIAVLVSTMFVSEVLEFSVFPSLLLLTTLFRLALEVTATRLILTNGDAGAVIQRFGQLVVSGNLVIGLIIFTILVVIQFMVITRGAERVSEVAARFTLDAMPGKQLAIDQELNSGMIREQEARARREKVQREADFYGAMDGASKFVRGDAMAGLVIVVINIVGGLIIGMAQRHLAPGQAVSTYSILTIGEALTTQIPALLLSTATGLLVTRSGNASPVGQDVLGQLTALPRVLYIVAIVLFLLALLGLPPIMPILLGAGAWYVGNRVEQRQKLQRAEGVRKEAQEREAARSSPEAALGLIGVDTLELEVGVGLVPLVGGQAGKELRDRITALRQKITAEMGLVIPPVRVRDNVDLGLNQYRIRVRGAEVALADVRPDRCLAIGEGNLDLPEVVPTRDPVFGVGAYWIRPDGKDRAEMSGFTVIDAGSVLVTHLSEMVRRHASEILGRQDVKALMDHVRKTHPVVVQELMPDLLTLGEIQRVLANLLRERVSIRDLPTILEALADQARHSRDIELLTEAVRQAIGRTIVRPYLSQGFLYTIVLSPDVETELSRSIERGEGGNYLNLDPEKAQRILTHLSELIKKIPAGARAVVLASPLVRFYFKRLTERTAGDLAVLSYAELGPDVPVKTVGVVQL